MPASELGQARSVLPQLLINQSPVSGLLDAEICLTDHQTAGWFRVTLALGIDPVVTATSLSSMTSALAEVRLGLGPSGLPAMAAVWQSLITGPIDDIVIDMVSGTASLTGRDLSSLFIDTLSAQSFANQTASEIAQTLAIRHGLTPNVTATTNPVGRYFQDGFDLFSLRQSSATVTEWDLLCGLAEAEGFDLFVQGQTLIFAPPLGQITPVVWEWMPDNSQGTSMTALRLQRSLALAHDIVVTVQSWNSRAAQLVTETVRASGQGAVLGTRSSTTNQAATYVLIRPNLSSQQALALATTTLQNLSRHQRVVTATMPGELSLAPRSLVALQGTNTDFDQTYIVDEVLRRVSMRDGFMQTVRLVNTPLSAGQ